MKNCTVITYGTFDLFHIGHLRLLQRAKEMGNHLIVGISTDEFNESKGKKTIIPYLQRSEIVANLKCVDQVIPERNWGQKRDDILDYDVNIFLMGDDWSGKFDDLKSICKVVYLPRTENVSSTQIKNSLGNLLSISKDEIMTAFDILDQIRKDLL